MKLSILGRLTAALLALFAVPALAQGTDRERGYVLGPADQVTVQVYGQPDAGVSTRIKTDGTIVMPLIGIIKAEGQTVITLADFITKKFVSGGFFKAPVVNVEVGAYVSRQVNVAGKVGAPGLYPLDREYRVLEMLLKANWVKDAGATYVYLRRGSDYKETKLDVELLVRGGADKDPVLQPGDTLYVPDADLIFLNGQIGRPGALPLLPKMTVRQAVAQAGGIGQTGSQNKVALYRAGGGSKEDVDLETILQKNDIIVIKERLF